MKQTVYLSDFRGAFERMDRKSNFSYEGLEIIYDFLESTNEDSELDVIAICCEFSEDSAEEIAQNYSIDISECETDEEKNNVVRAYLEENTTLVGETESTFVFLQF